MCVCVYVRARAGLWIGKCTRAMVMVLGTRERVNACARDSERMRVDEEHPPTTMKAAERDGDTERREAGERARERKSEREKERERKIDGEVAWEREGVGAR